MLSKKMAVFVCVLMILPSSCTARTPDQLPIVTPQFTPELPTPTTASTGIVPTGTPTPLPTPIPRDAISPNNLRQVELLHEYWQAVAQAAVVDPYEMDISAIAASPQGRYLAVGGCSTLLTADLRSGNVYCSAADSNNPAGLPFLLILDANTEAVIGTIPENEIDTTIADLAFTHDGEKLIYAIQPGKFAIWDISSGEIESVLWEGETSAPRVAVSLDGKWWALKTSDHVLIWDVANNEFVAEIPAYFRPQFSADSRRLLIYHDEEFIIYETGSWIELLRFGIPCECVYAFSTDLSLFATSERSSAENAPILIWDVSTGEQIESLPGTEDFTAFLLFSPDGKMLWRVGERGDLMAWSTSDWQILAEQIGGIRPIFNLRGFQFVEDGRHYLLLSDLHLGLYGVP